MTIASSPQELEAFLAEHSAWQVVTSPLPGEYPKTRTELFRRFRFPSFDHVLSFMTAAAPFINEHDHHPRWEHVFKTLDVFLSTWDSGHVISRLDCDLARHLDALYAQGGQVGQS